MNYKLKFYLVGGVCIATIPILFIFAFFLRKGGFPGTPRKSSPEFLQMLFYVLAILGGLPILMNLFLNKTIQKSFFSGKTFNNLATT